MQEMTRQPNYHDILTDLLKTHTPLLNGNSVEAKRQEILRYFHDTFTLYESIFECLKNDEAFYTPPNTLRHPLIFYYGHTSVFFINKLNIAGLINERVDPKVESMLAIGVDEMSWDDLDEQHYNWPSVEEVKAYRDKTRAIVDRVIREYDFTLPITWENPFWVIIMGIEHERIHLETTSVLIRELPIEMVRTHPVWGNICRKSGTVPENILLPVTGGTIQLGKNRDNPVYGWDNEFGQAEFQVKDFKASQYLVSNQEFLAFVKADGYRQKEFWTEEGWQWVQFRNAQCPVYWIKKGEDYFYRTMLEIIPMPWDWPVDINYLEAKAFCNWKSKQTEKSIRMPTEAEWYCLRNLVDADQPTWNQAPGNINLEYYMSACPVNTFQFANSFFDIIGNVWQWTETPFDGFNGFEPHTLYDDFSTPTFDGQHNVFKGGCWASTGNYAIKDSRYAFRRHFFQHAGLRYVEAEPLPQTIVNTYEKDTMISQYIELHYGETYFDIPNFPVACARACLKALEGKRKERALDLGCATGRTSFELATEFDYVDAIDFSARLIETPTALQKKGSKRYVIQDEGDLVTYKDVRLKDFPEYVTIKDRIHFMQGDACNLAEKFTDYDLVFAGNLLDRLYDPKKFLNQIKSRIRPGGLLVLTSPYTWLDEFTEHNKWLGGFKAQTGENYTTLEGIADTLAPEFTLLGEPRDIPFVIRETKRKFQHTLAQMSIWKRQS